MRHLPDDLFEVLWYLFELSGARPGPGLSLLL